MVDTFEDLGFSEERPSKANQNNDFQQLGFVAQPQPQQTGTTSIDAIRNILGLTPTALQTPFVAEQDLQKMGLGLPGAKSAVANIASFLTGGGTDPSDITKIIGSRKISPEQIQPTSVIDNPTIAAQVLGGLGAGVIGAEFGGAGAGAALEAIPGATAALSALPRALGFVPRIAGSAAFGAALDPESRKRGALEGASFGTGVESLLAAWSALRGIKKGAQVALRRFSPEQAYEDILNDLSSDRKLSKNALEENSKSAALDIKNMKEKIEKENERNFSPIFKKVGKKDIYTDFIPEGKLFPEDKSQYLNLDKKILDQYTPDLDTLHQEFIKNPTFRNATNLRTELGSESARSAIDVLGIRAKQSASKARKALSNDMFSFLNRADDTGDLANQYNDAVNFHRDEFIPYKSNEQIWKIANGEVTNPRNLTTIFKSPEGRDEIDNFTKTAKVLNDLGSEFHKKILFNELGKAKNAKGLINEFEKLDNKRLASYITPKLEENIENLKNKTIMKELVQRGAGGLVGGLAGSIVAPIFGTAAGATAGAAFLPKLLRGLRLGKGLQTGQQQARSISPESMQFLARLLLANRTSQQQRTQQ